MKFSIVTVSFNQARYLEETIRSVIEQDYPDIEYIVVDPGSTDGSRDIIERYRHKISKTVFKPDKGAADGLNNGFSEATGEIYGFVNSDDLLLPGALTQVARYFESDPTLEILSGHARIIDPDGKRIRDSYTDKFNERAFVYGGVNICQMSTFFRADLIRRSTGFNVSNRVAWDAEFFVNLLRLTNKYVVVDAILSAFRVHANAITGGGTMTEQQRVFLRTLFEHIMGRPWSRRDDFIRFYYLARKYVLEPRSLVQRILHGSIYGRYSSTRSRR